MDETATFSGGSTATVKEWIPSSEILVVTDLSGSFTALEDVEGSISSAIWVVKDEHRSNSYTCPCSGNQWCGDGVACGYVALESLVNAVQRARGIGTSYGKVRPPVQSEWDASSCDSETLGWTTHWAKNFGYSVAFTTDNNVALIVGAPDGKNGGKVFVYGSFTEILDDGSERHHKFMLLHQLQHGPEKPNFGWSVAVEYSDVMEIGPHLANYFIAVGHAGFEQDEDECNFVFNYRDIYTLTEDFAFNDETGAPAYFDEGLCPAELRRLAQIHDPIYVVLGPADAS